MLKRKIDYHETGLTMYFRLEHRHTMCRMITHAALAHPDYTGKQMGREKKDKGKKSSLGENPRQRGGENKIRILHR